VPHLIGTAIFRKDRLAGFLDSEETKDLIFIRNKIKGGLLIEGIGKSNKSTPVSLEIFDSITTIKPVVEGKNIAFNLNIKTITAIDEIEGTKDLIDENGRNKLEESAQKKLKKGIEGLISKLQSEYYLDIFGFGAKLKGNNPYVWKQVSNNWGNLFRDIDVNVVTKIHIRNSATLSKPLKEGD
jgi:spore germination protein KC